MKSKIISKQLMVLLALSSFSFITSISSAALRFNFWDSMLSVGIAFALNVLLAIPVILLYKRKQNITENIVESKYKKLFITLFILYFLVSDVISISQVGTLFLNVEPVDSSPTPLFFLLLITAVYGAIKGIESVARSSYFVMIISAIALLMLIIACVDIVDFEKTQVFFYEGVSDITINTITIFSRCTVLPQLAVLIYTVKDKLEIKQFLISQIVVAVLIIALILLVVLTMGNFAQTQMHPIFTLFSVGKLKIINRLDAFFSVICLLVSCIEFSLTFVSIKVLFTHSNMKKYSNRALILSAFIIIVLSLYLTKFNSNLSAEIQFFLFIPAVVLGTCLPSYYLIKGEDKNG